MFVANKTDLRNDRVITSEQAKTDLLDFINGSQIRATEDKYRSDPKETVLGQDYGEVSAKDVDSVSKLFKKFVGQIISN